MSKENEQTNVLKEILKWIKVSAIKDIKSVLEDEFKDNDIKKQVYQLSDGTKGTKKIAKLVKHKTYSTILRYWKSWEKLGLGESIPIKGGKRFQHSFNLKDFGIKITEIKEDSKQLSSDSKKANTK